MAAKIDVTVDLINQQAASEIWEKLYPTRFRVEYKSSLIYERLEFGVKSSKFVCLDFLCSRRPPVNSGTGWWYSKVIMDISLLTSTTESTKPCPPKNTLSGGSAAFIVITLILGCLAQPPGCLILPSTLGSYRVWRLNPLTCSLEGITILTKLLYGPFTRTSQKEQAFTIMAQRTTSDHNEKRSLVGCLGRPKLELMVPVLLQIVKVMFVRGSLVTTILAAMYGLDWIVVQYCHCYVWFRPFTYQHPTCNHTREERLNKDICKIYRPSTNPGDILRNKIVATLMFCFDFFCGTLVWFVSGLRVSDGRNDLPILKFMLINAARLLALNVVGLIGLRAYVHHDKEVRVPKIWACAMYGFMCIFFLALVYFYTTQYEEAGTFKPPWLDWLG